MPTCAPFCLLTSTAQGQASDLIPASSSHLHRLNAFTPRSPDPIPTELLMEIIKYYPLYYPELYLDIDAAIHGVPSEQFDGNDVLHALSQTSRVLRGIFLPLLWARVHACMLHCTEPAQMQDQNSSEDARTPHDRHPQNTARSTAYGMPNPSFYFYPSRF